MEGRKEGMEKKLLGVPFFNIEEAREGKIKNDSMQREKERGGGKNMSEEKRATARGKNSLALERKEKEKKD